MINLPDKNKFIVLQPGKFCSGEACYSLKVIYSRQGSIVFTRLVNPNKTARRQKFFDDFGLI
jgi:hypothetical protein